MDWLEDIKEISEQVPYGQTGFFLTRHHGGEVGSIEATQSKSIKLKGKPFEDQAALILQLIKNGLKEHPDGSSTLTVQQKGGEITMLTKTDQVRKTYKVV